MPLAYSEAELIENHPGCRVVYIILTVEGRRVTSERTKLCRIW